MIVLSIVMLILSAVVAVSAFAQGEQRLRACIEPEFKGGQEGPELAALVQLACVHILLNLAVLG
jgi:hypothetical protein